MIILFVRHANSKKDKLTRLGKKQCKVMLSGKEGIKFSKIYSSPANRCVKTARYLQKKYKIPLEVAENFKERELLKTKTPQNEREQEWYENYMNPLYSSTNPEGCKEFLTRNYVELKKIINEHFDNNENVVIVGHSGTSYAVSTYINGIKRGHNVSWLRVGNCSKIYFEVLSKD